MYAFTTAQQLWTHTAFAAAAPLAAADKQQADGEKPVTPDKLPAAAEQPGIEQPSTPALPVGLRYVLKGFDMFSTQDVSHTTREGSISNGYAVTV